MAGGRGADPDRPAGPAGGGAAGSSGDSGIGDGRTGNGRTDDTGTGGGVRVTVVGIGDDGWTGLADPARDVLSAAEVIMGSGRQLALLPETVRALRVGWPSPLVAALPDLIAAHAGSRICALASGDPMFFGLGNTLVRLLGADRVRVLPHPSAVSLACARLGWPLDSTEVVSLVGRPLATVHPTLVPGRRLLVLSADRRTPAQLCALLTARGYGASRVTILEHLAGPAERRREVLARELTSAGTPGTPTHVTGLPAADVEGTVEVGTGRAGTGGTGTGIADLNLLAVDLVAGAGARHLPRVPGLPDDVFEHDGQLTKREIRAVTLAALAPAPGQLLWDVGAGSGSIAIEWMRTHPDCRAAAVEPRPDRADRIARNAEALGVPALRIVVGAAPAALADLAALAGPPDAVFVGGGLTVPGTIDRCWDLLAAGGRLVANAVTVESEVVLAGWHARLGGDLVRLAVSRADPVGGFTGWRPLRQVTQWSVTRPHRR